MRSAADGGVPAPIAGEVLEVYRFGTVSCQRVVLTAPGRSGLPLPATLDEGRRTLRLNDRRSWQLATLAPLPLAAMAVQLMAASSA